MYLMRFDVDMLTILMLLLFHYIGNVQGADGDISSKFCKKHDNIYKPVMLITGGDTTKSSEFPHMAAIGYQQKTVEFHCGGTLISEKFVLTAAHCLYTDYGDPRVVRLGSVNIEKPDTHHVDYAISKWIVHPEYNSSYRYTFGYADLALLQLSNTVIFNKFIKPACLETNSSFDASNIMVTGWGCTDKSNASTILLKAKLGLKGDFCKVRYAIKYPVGSYACFGDKENIDNKGACQGDSGGPIQIFKHGRYYIVDVVSAGERETHTTIGTTVSYYIGWIEKQVWGQTKLFN